MDVNERAKPLKEKFEWTITMMTGCKRLWTGFLDGPVLNQMAAEMGKCCPLQHLLLRPGHVPPFIVLST